MSRLAGGVPLAGDGDARCAGRSLPRCPWHRRLLVPGLLSFGWAEGEGQGQSLPGAGLHQEVMPGKGIFQIAFP